MTIDVHIHYLPGVDDGAADLEESIEMCLLAAEDGCEALIATPHQRHPDWRNLDRIGLEARLDQVRDAVGERPELHLGAEIRVSDGLLDDISRLPGSELIPLAGSRYLLLELDSPVEPLRVEELIHELVIENWRPIVAHPEFITGLSDQPEQMARLARAGALFQITAMSLTGGFGARTRRSVKRMLRAGLVDFVASDAHRATWRPPGLRQAFDEIVSLRDRETAERLTSGNPRAVLEDQPLVVYAAG